MLNAILAAKLCLFNLNSSFRGECTDEKDIQPSDDVIANGFGENLTEEYIFSDTVELMNATVSDIRNLASKNENVTILNSFEQETEITFICNYCTFLNDEFPIQNVNVYGKGMKFLNGYLSYFEEEGKVVIEQANLHISQAVEVDSIINSKIWTSEALSGLEEVKNVSLSIRPPLLSDPYFNEVNINNSVIYYTQYGNACMANSIVASNSKLIVNGIEFKPRKEFISKFSCERCLVNISLEVIDPEEDVYKTIKEITSLENTFLFVNYELTANITHVDERCFAESVSGSLENVYSFFNITFARMPSYGSEKSIMKLFELEDGVAVKEFSQSIIAQYVQYPPAGGMIYLHVLENCDQSEVDDYYESSTSEDEVEISDICKTDASNLAGDKINDELPYYSNGMWSNTEYPELGNIFKFESQYTVDLIAMDAFECTINEQPDIEDMAENVAKTCTEPNYFNYESKNCSSYEYIIETITLPDTHKKLEENSMIVLITCSVLWVISAIVLAIVLCKYRQTKSKVVKQSRPKLAPMRTKSAESKNKSDSIQIAIPQLDDSKLIGAPLEQNTENHGEEKQEESYEYEEVIENVYEGEDFTKEYENMMK